MGWWPFLFRFRPGLGQPQRVRLLDTHRSYSTTTGSFIILNLLILLLLNHPPCFFLMMISLHFRSPLSSHSSRQGSGNNMTKKFSGLAVNDDKVGKNSVLIYRQGVGCCIYYLRELEFDGSATRIR